MRYLTLWGCVKFVLRVAIPVIVVGGCFVLLSGKLAAADLSSLPGRVSDITAIQWSVALCLAICSFWSVGQYDSLAHRALNSRIPDKQAHASGMISIALGQTLGLGLFTGALARWRMLPGLSIAAALRLSAFVAFSFVLAWSVVTAIACMFLPAPAWTLVPAVLTIAAALSAAVIVFRWPQFCWRGRALWLPSLPLAAAIIGWTALDTIFAAGVLFVFLPETTLGFASFLPLFLIALGAALVSNAPGGVGPFELVLLTALPKETPETLLTAIIAYRIIYYALPAGLALLALMRPFTQRTASPCIVTTRCDSTRRPEVAVVHQNGGAVLTDIESTLALWPTGQTTTLFADPLAGTSTHALQHLEKAAYARATLPMIYKCDVALAIAARASGWSVLHIADDALVCVSNYDPNVPARRNLRRKLRAAAKSGIVIKAGVSLPHPALARVDADWQRNHGTARGGSMGRYAKSYVQDQWVAGAYLDDTLLAFITVHRGQSSWCLDLMRHKDGAPDGTMHALVDAAILAARAAGADDLSLASTPACPNPHSVFWRWAALQVVTRSGGHGLRQFKSAFAPRWVPRYVAAPGPLRLMLGLADLTRAIHLPPELATTNTKQIHHLDEDYELASSRVA